MNLKEDDMLPPDDALEGRSSLWDESGPLDERALLDDGDDPLEEGYRTESEDYTEDEVETPSATYLREISRARLLTADEEVELARAIERGGYARAELDDLPGECDRAHELRQLIADGDQARRKLTEANLRFVVSVARKYLRRGLSLPDLIQEGNIGLSRAVANFDHTKGFRFSTYAYWWIRQAVTRAMAEQAGGQLEVSRERVPHIEPEALQKLRPPNLRILPRYPE